MQWSYWKKQDMKNPNLTVDLNAYWTFIFAIQDNVSEVDVISLEKFLSLEFCLHFHTLK